MKNNGKHILRIHFETLESVSKILRLADSLHTNLEVFFQNQAELNLKPGIHGVLLCLHSTDRFRAWLYRSLASFQILVPAIYDAAKLNVRDQKCVIDLEK